MRQMKPLSSRLVAGIIQERFHRVHRLPHGDIVPVTVADLAEGPTWISEGVDVEHPAEELSVVAVLVPALHAPAAADRWRFAAGAKHATDRLMPVLGLQVDDDLWFRTVARALVEASRQVDPVPSTRVPEEAESGDIEDGPEPLL